MRSLRTRCRLLTCELDGEVDEATALAAEAEQFGTRGVAAAARKLA
jgi:hypothetical protein